MARTAVRPASCIAALLGCLWSCAPTEDPAPSDVVAPAQDQEALPDYRAVILVTIDTLRADHVSMNGYLRETTPFLDDLAQRSVVFDNAQATMPFTGPSHSSMLTGLHPFQHGVMINGQSLNPEIPNVAQRFRDAGYKTAAFVSTGFIRNVTSSFETVVLGKRTGRATMKQAAEWVEGLDADTPFFLWVHLFNVHEWESEKKSPQNRPSLAEASPPLEGDAWYDYLAERHGWPMVKADDPFPEFAWDTNQAIINNRDQLLETVDLYDARVQYADGSVRILFKRLNAALGSDPTLWVITADHGEGLGSHSYKGHSSQVFQEQIHVPLIVFQQPALAPRHVQGIVSLVDLAPTLTASLGLRDDAWESLSLWPLIHGTETKFSRPALAQRSPVGSAGDVFALMSEGRKYFYRVRYDDAYYDLTADPQELSSNLDSPDAEFMRALLQVQLQSRNWKAGDQDTDMSGFSEELLQELKALGYVE